MVDCFRLRALFDMTVDPSFKCPLFFSLLQNNLFLHVFNPPSLFLPLSQTYEQSEWVIHIAGRLLANDTSILSLMEYNPFQGRDNPRYTYTD